MELEFEARIQEEEDIGTIYDLFYKGIVVGELYLDDSYNNVSIREITAKGEIEPQGDNIS